MRGYSQTTSGPIEASAIANRQVVNTVNEVMRRGCKSWFWALWINLQIGRPDKLRMQGPQSRGLATTVATDELQCLSRTPQPICELRNIDDSQLDQRLMFEFAEGIVAQIQMGKGTSQWAHGSTACSQASAMMRCPAGVGCTPS